MTQLPQVWVVTLPAQVRGPRVQGLGLRVAGAPHATLTLTISVPWYGGVLGNSVWQNRGSTRSNPVSRCLKPLLSSVPEHPAQVGCDMRRVRLHLFHLRPLHRLFPGHIPGPRYAQQAPPGPLGPAQSSAACLCFWARRRRWLGLGSWNALPALLSTAGGHKAPLFRRSAPRTGPGRAAGGRCTAGWEGGSQAAGPQGRAEAGSGRGRLWWVPPFRDGAGTARRA